jgi:hypothetical protein
VQQLTFPKSEPAKRHPHSQPLARFFSCRFSLWRGKKENTHKWSAGGSKVTLGTVTGDSSLPRGMGRNKKVVRILAEKKYMLYTNGESKTL